MHFTKFQNQLPVNQPNVHQYFDILHTKGRHRNEKNVSIRALPESEGGGLPLPEFFGHLF